MFNKLIIALSSIAVGFICISSIDIYDNAVSSEVNEKPDYVSLFTEESESILEQAYINENDTFSEQAYIKENDTFFAVNLPYYKKEPEAKTITVPIKPNRNSSIFHELKK